MTSAEPSKTGTQAPSHSNPAAAPSSRCVVPWKEARAPVARPALECPEDPSGGAAETASATIEVLFPEVDGGLRIIAEHVKSEAERQRGLMYRTELALDRGMLFSWNDERLRSFWMKNTCVPLDMLFIAADGTIVSILEQVPTLNTQPRRSGCPAQHVLEVNAGWAREHGVRPGQRVRFED